MRIFFIHKSNLFKIWIFLVIFATLFFLFSTFVKESQMQSVYNSISTDNLLYTINKLTNQNEKVAYLTFDDGPTSTITPKILDILKEEDVKATFFVIGKSVKAHPAIVKRAYEEGHYIANHTYSHNNDILYKSTSHFIDEIKKTDSAIGNAIGEIDYCSHIFRFPNGFMAPLYKTQKQKILPLLEKIDYAYIDWNCLNNDSMAKYTNAQLLENLKQTSKGKNPLVILMHDTKDVSNSSLVLKDSIEYLKEQGYTFKNFYEFIDN